MPASFVRRPAQSLFSAGIVRRVGISAAIVYGFLATLVDDAGEVAVRPEAVQAATGFSRATTYRTFARLAAAGFLEWLPAKRREKAILRPPVSA